MAHRAPHWLVSQILLCKQWRRPVTGQSVPGHGGPARVPRFHACDLQRVPRRRALRRSAEYAYGMIDARMDRIAKPIADSGSARTLDDVAPARDFVGAEVEE